MAEPAAQCPPDKQDSKLGSLEEAIRQEAEVASQEGSGGGKGKGSVTAANQQSMTETGQFVHQNSACSRIV